jgi:hypothetical protein
MVINGLDLVDFGQQLGIGSLRAECGSQKDEGKGYRGFLDHGRFVLRACASKGKPQRTTLQSVLSTARQSCNERDISPRRRGDTEKIKTVTHQNLNTENTQNFGRCGERKEKRNAEINQTNTSRD